MSGLGGRATASVIGLNGQLDPQAVQRAIQGLLDALNDLHGDADPRKGFRRVSKQVIAHRGVGSLDERIDRGIVFDPSEKAIYALTDSGDVQARINLVASGFELCQVTANVAGAITVQRVDTSGNLYGETFGATDMNGTSPIVGTNLWVGWRRNVTTQAPEAVFT